MIDFILLLGAATLSGSLLFLLAAALDRTLGNNAGPQALYFILKLSLIYFCTPAIFLGIFMTGMYSYVPAAENQPDFLGFYFIHCWKGIAMKKMTNISHVFEYRLLGIWLLGALLTSAGISMRKQLYLHRLLKLCAALEDGPAVKAAHEAAASLNVKQTPQLFLCPYLDGPFLFGFFQPKIIVPAISLSEEDWSMIFLHELTHYRSRDTLFRFFITLIKGLNWFNPLIYCFSRLFYDYGELACDEKVAKQMTRVQKAHYARLLLKLARYSIQAPYTASFSNNSEAFFQRRVYIIMKKNVFKKKTISTILAFAVAGLSCPAAAYGASWTTMQVYNAIAEQSIKANSIEMIPNDDQYVEQVSDSPLLPDAGISIPALTRAANPVDLTLAAGKSISVDTVTTVGTEIRIALYSDYSSDQFRAGILEPSGAYRHVSSQNGMVSYTFYKKEHGTYKITFENPGNSNIHLAGTVFLNNQDHQTTTFQGEDTRNLETEALIESRDRAILSTFNVDLTGYKEINPPEEEYFAEGLLTARRQIDLKYGDTIPITYISSDKDHAYTFKQDITGINYMYEFIRNNDDWTLVASSEMQGNIMENGRRNRNVKFEENTP